MVSASLRHPRTRQEMIVNQDGLARASRNNLPTDREDKPKSTQRSWKKHRRTKYKTV